jgi:hypothetical protein
MIAALQQRIFLGVLLVLLAVAGSPAELRAAAPSQEYQLKLAFLVNFARFITWPESSFTATKGQLTVCVVGKNPFGDELSKIESRKVGKHQLRTILVEANTPIDQCHLLFVGSTSTSQLPQLLDAIKRGPVVAVSDIPGFTDQGGGIELVLKQDRLAFIINNSRLKNVGIQAASPMLNLALEVR